VQLRPSRVLKKLRSGKPVCCVKLNLADPSAAEIAALCGVDCVWLDREHVASDLSAIGNQIRAAKAHDVDALVRVPRGSYSDLVHPLEMDAAGIMVPHLMGLEDARRVAWQTRFHPIGRRPIDGGNADGGYCMVSTSDYVRQANRQRFVIVQIEDPEPMDELERIAQVEGIDVLFFGPGDFSHAIGAPGEMDHPRVIEARRLIAEAARRHGKFAGTVASPDTLAETVALGYQFVNIASDVVALGNAFRQASEAFAKLGT
jgi:4-hydroxy-2-oxoheptanedioate aldolase